MRALISVYDKTGLEAFAQGLTALGVELIASGGTSDVLTKSGIAHMTVEQLTGEAEMLGGRVKTLHPKVHGGILADRSKSQHVTDLESRGITPIDLVICNLYPFSAKPSIEMIDVGGPTMVRAAAKNHAHVGIVVDPADYGPVLDELRTEGALSEVTRKRLARTAFAHTASYDATIVGWFDADDENPLPRTLHLSLERAQPLRYGENPHQSGARYRQIGSSSMWDSTIQHGGKELSFLNINDAEAAWRLANDMSKGPAVAIIKHANPCGAAVDKDIVSAYVRAYECDPTSAFGGVVAINRVVTSELAEAITAVFTEVVIAPAYEPEALVTLRTKANLRVLEAPIPAEPKLDFRTVDGGLLVQTADTVSADRNEWRTVTKAAPTEEQWADLALAWKICAHVKSNAIVLVANGQGVGIGAGQQSRVDAGEIAVRKAAGRAKDGVCASDAFFPFRDGVDMAANAGVAAIIQPGGSLRDDEVIEAANELGIAMVFTGERHFRH